MPKVSLAELTAFATVARHRSFRQAADSLGMSRSALSHTLIGLERTLGVRLLNRTTRSVSPTEAGGELLRRIVPVLQDLDEALDAVTGEAGAIGGILRINCPAAATETLLRMAVPTFAERYPGVDLDLVTDGRLIDIVEAGFDAGVRLREAVPQDMISVPFGGNFRFLVVAAPAYLESHGNPVVPDDLRGHRCIRHRMPSGKLYRWEFEKRGEEIVVDVPGSLTLDDSRLMAAAAADGLGIAFVAESFAEPELRAGRVVTVLEDWCPAYPGLCLYYPGRRHVPAALRAFIEVLKHLDRPIARPSVED
ncbi:LysR family transcriptional regulator [Aurantimonas endophytica]|uniref:DNA-binding transcriptional LysR family regulator n=1 Tax=Aurantimonas endophytica TaxID=1522175 RepID=A0A7W6H9Q5_9HYPH|nr:LysR family transcriptional regulator [Aurantimonas endophytica]MBB4001225.1 DNA-binding transcriptional LysR family regulator [Aurantimonas endophytica]MCO6403125.1 LysR family transcriptional regulator [Aurantimonas endophytica]